jgi:carboxyl-terminal processing protease
MELPQGKDKLIRLGVIDLPSFYSQFELEGQKPGSEQKSTTIDVARLIRKLVSEHIAGIVLDLRRNGGGSLEEAINLTGLFIKEGPGRPGQGAGRRTDHRKGPGLAGVLRWPADRPDKPFQRVGLGDSRRRIAGLRTRRDRRRFVDARQRHGAIVASVIAVHAAARHRRYAHQQPGRAEDHDPKFYRASGSSTQLKGVVPDIILPSINNHMEVGEGSLDNPLPWDTIPACELHEGEPHRTVAAGIAQALRNARGHRPGFRVHP